MDVTGFFCPTTLGTYEMNDLTMLIEHLRLVKETEETGTVYEKVRNKVGQAKDYVQKHAGKLAPTGGAARIGGYAAGGAGIGGALGAGLGAATGRQGTRKRRALIGGMIGTGLGAAVGAYGPRTVDWAKRPTTGE